MNNAKNIVLTGFMGTGKSTVGRRLAALTERRFVDSDTLIETEAQLSIPNIFAQHGEAHFRLIEATVAQRLAQMKGLIIATGGGLMLNEESAVALGKSGDIFCLVASADAIFERLKSESGQRPLLNTPNPKARIAALLSERADAYGRFPQIDTTNMTPDQIAQEILAHL